MPPLDNGDETSRAESGSLIALQGAPIARHQFDAALISLLIQLVLSAPVSQRAAAAVFRLFAAVMGWDDQQVPSANSIRLWLFRLGLYALRAPKPQADDWVWMVDHTVQMGPWKCLVIVGVRASEWKAVDRPLEHEDLEVLNITPMSPANQEAVAAQLQETIAQTGVPMAVLSDEGAELKGGMKLFNERLRETAAEPDKFEAIPHLHDIKHKAALFLKQRLEASDIWTDFVTRLTRTRVNVILTPLAFLNPPRLRNKARYMNLESVVTWGRKVLRFFEDPHAQQVAVAEGLDLKSLESKLGWIREFAEPLEEWAEMLSVIEVVEHYVRVDGYHRGPKRDLRDELRAKAHRSETRRLGAKLLRFVHHESKKLPKDRSTPTPGHTEVLESLLAKYKQTQARHSQGGMTSSLLNIGAAVCGKSLDVVQQALSTIPVSAVTEWTKNNLGPTVASMHRRLLTHNEPSEEQIRSENALPAQNPI